MPRLPRRLLVAEESVNHCTWQAHNHELLFQEPGAPEQFLLLLAKYKLKHGIRIYALCIMGTHPHLLCKCENGQKEFSKFWKVVNHGLACWYNRRCNRRGQVVMDRLASPRVEDGRHLLEVMRYGDMNPVKAGLVKTPKDWAWSSYRHYAFGEENPLIDDAPEYLALGRTAPERRKAYQALFATRLTETLEVDRPDIVHGPFFGEPSWVATMLRRSGLSPPGSSP